MGELYTGARSDVLEFYEELPFNLTEVPENEAALIKQQNMVEILYPMVENFYEADTVLEMGCGTGWLSNSIAYYYGLKVTAVDFNPIAIAAAQKCARELNVDVDFQCMDLFLYESAPKDIVISNGVLHHTSDVWGGVFKCIDLTKHGGYIFIGLYHRYGRMPFLQYFREMREKGIDEEYLFRKYRELDNRHTDDVQARSWFRDQVLHPYETQHTLKEIVGIFQEADVQLISTSINNYEKIDSLEALYDMEKQLYDIGMRYLENKKYYPGFFYVLGRKN